MTGHCADIFDGYPTLTQFIAKKDRHKLAALVVWGGLGQPAVQLSACDPVWVQPCKHNRLAIRASQREVDIP
eukprot:SAG22_NODE_1722_length_3723_cov_4.966060_3_plen_72_part_00